MVKNIISKIGQSINLKRVNFIFNKSFFSSYFIEQIYIYEEENIISISKHIAFKTHLIPISIKPFTQAGLFFCET